MIKILIVFLGNDAKFNNVVIDAIKLILLNYNNFSMSKIVVKKIERVKSTLSCFLTNTKLIFNKLVLIETIQKG